MRPGSLASPAESQNQTCLFLTLLASSAWNSLSRISHYFSLLELSRPAFSLIVSLFSRVAVQGHESPVSIYSLFAERFCAMIWFWIGSGRDSQSPGFVTSVWGNPMPVVTGSPRNLTAVLSISYVDPPLSMPTHISPIRKALHRGMKTQTSLQYRYNDNHHHHHHSKYLEVPIVCLFRKHVSCFRTCTSSVLASCQTGNEIPSTRKRRLVIDRRFVSGARGIVRFGCLDRQIDHWLESGRQILPAGTRTASRYSVYTALTLACAVQMWSRLCCALAHIPSHFASIPSISSNTMKHFS